MAARGQPARQSSPYSTPLGPSSSRTDPRQQQPADTKRREEDLFAREDEVAITDPLCAPQGHPLSEKNVKSFEKFIEERASRSRQGSTRGAESHYSGITVQTMASIQEELTQTKEIMADLAQSVKSLAEEMKQLKLSSKHAEARGRTKAE